ncbi:J domain-containing protein [Spirillospora sp. CA-294931]|uniref:J domain-containing protein n=1 Tax=Spirillospora sp. CA-294931 TaxID=3240042 RepID=UPI003D914E8F
MGDYARELDGEDAYALLGVGQDASEEEIRRGRRTAVRDVHPDHRQGDAEAEARTRLINRAYEILTRERAEYDAFRASGDDPWDDAGDGVAPAPARQQPPSPKRGRPGAVFGFAVSAMALLGLVLYVSTPFSSDAESADLAVVPRQFAGTWSGTVTYSGAFTDSRSVTVTLKTGAERGRIEYHGDDGCAAALDPMGVSGQKLTLVERPLGKGCVEGTVEALVVEEQLRLTFVGAGVAVLTRR